MRLFISKLILELVICHSPVAVHAATDKSVYSDADINLELKSASSATLQVPASYEQNQRQAPILLHLRRVHPCSMRKRSRLSEWKQTGDLYKHCIHRSIYI